MVALSSQICLSSVNKTSFPASSTNFIRLSMSPQVCLSCCLSSRTDFFLSPFVKCACGLLQRNVISTFTLFLMSATKGSPAEQSLRCCRSSSFTFFSCLLLGFMALFTLFTKMDLRSGTGFPSIVAMKRSVPSSTSCSILGVNVSRRSICV